MKHRIRTLSVSLAAVSLTAVCLALRSGKDDGPEVGVAVVTRGDIEATVPAAGRIRPIVEVEIAAEVSGEIVRLPVREGMKVRAGDTLLQVRQDSYLAALESARASLGMLNAQFAQQKARTAQARSELARAVRMHNENAMSDSELEAAETAARISEGELEGAGYAVQRGEAALREAEEGLAGTVVKAPMSGTVSALYVRKGERVVGTSQMSGTMLMCIADLGKMELVADLGENDVVDLHDGDMAEIRIDACRNAKYRGKITQIANSAKNIAGTFGQVANFEVRIAVLSTEPGSEDIVLRPGMSATATIITGRRTGVPTIPAQCVFTRDHAEMVWVVGDDGKSHPVEIKTGIQDFDRIEIVSGLNEGAEVICSPYKVITDGLTDGTTVRVTNRQDNGNTRIANAGNEH